MKIIVGVSNHHIHLTEEHLKHLFGDVALESYKPLLQPNCFASQLTLTVETPKGIISNVRVIGPVRSYTQVEISKTESYQLGIKPPIRDSGDLKNSSVVTLIGPHGSITTECCILANRHIHMSKEQKLEMGLEDATEVCVKVEGEKGGLLEHVKIKLLDQATPELHLDTDDANAFLLKTGDYIEIIKN